MTRSVCLSHLLVSIDIPGYLIVIKINCFLLKKKYIFVGLKWDTF